MSARKTLLIPALLDHHWPLLRWAFESRRFHAVVLEESAEEVQRLVDAARRAPVRREKFVKEIREGLRSFAKGAQE